jgi:hypothetical protein
LSAIIQRSPSLTASIADFDGRRSPMGERPGKRSPRLVTVITRRYV